ncbi:MAG: transporter [Alphaproteobacteria bacterium]|nr:transporter [Alphaproteobacteria bacterium]
MSASISLQTVADGGSISAISKRVVALMFLVALVDSYDQISLAFAAPALVAQWGIEKGAMGPVFSVQLFGLLIGGILFGAIGDRLGRKFAIISGLLFFGLLSLLTVLATNITQLLVIRFLVGLGVGGVIPNAIALSNEFSPRRYQVTAVSLMFIGYVCGGVGGGIVSAWLIPRFGWEIVFWVGGLFPVLLAGFLQFTLPESIRFLASSGDQKRQREATRLASLMRPDLAIGPETRIVNEAASIAHPGVRELFAGPLRPMTLLLWLMYLANSATAFGLISWLPILVGTLGFGAKPAALATALTFAGAAFGGVVMSRMVDRSGLGPIVAMPAIAIPFVAGIGFLGGSQMILLYLLTFMTGFFALGFQNSLHGIGGSIYPTAVRATGVGWAMAAGKIGGVIGPAVIGVLISAGASPQTVFIAASTPLLVSIVGVVMLRGIYRVNVHGARETYGAASGS